MFFATGHGTDTLAVLQHDGTYRLYGYKWFSSATDSNMTFTLARVVDSQGQVVQVINILCPVNKILDFQHKKTEMYAIQQFSRNIISVAAMNNFKVHILIADF